MTKFVSNEQLFKWIQSCTQVFYLHVLAWISKDPVGHMLLQAQFAVWESIQRNVRQHKMIMKCSTMTCV